MMEDGRLARPAAKRRKNAAHGVSRRKKMKEMDKPQRSERTAVRKILALSWRSASSPAIQASKNDRL